MMISRRQLVVTAALTLACPAVLCAAPLRLRLAHGLPTTHPVHASMQHFADLVRQRTNGEIDIVLFADGQLGQEVDLLSQVQAGKLDFLKVSASLLERYNSTYKVLNLPFMLRDSAHWRALTTNDVGREILDSTAPAGLVGIAFYDAGSRSFYGRRPFYRPDDLRGLKVRIQSSSTMSRLLTLFGAEPVELAWSNVYIGLKSGLVDAAENSVAALIVGNHADVVSHFSMDEHTTIPDVLLVGTARMESLPDRTREIIREAALASHYDMNERWSAFEVKCRAEIEQRGVAFVQPDRASFIARAQPIIEMFAGEYATKSLRQRIAQS